MKPLTLLFTLALAACASSPPPVPVPEPVTNAKDMHGFAVDAFKAGRYREAMATFRRAERLFLSLDDARGVAASSISQAEIHLLLGETGLAAKPLQRAKEAIARTGNPLLRDRAQLLEARISIADDPAMTRRLLNNLKGAAPPVAMQAQLLLCELNVKAGDTECAATLVSDDALSNARILQVQAQVAMMNGNRDTSRALLEQALDIYRALAWRPGIAAVHESMADVAAQAEDVMSAREHLERALYVRLWLQDRVRSAELLARLQNTASDETVRKRYGNWRETLLDNSTEPEWTDMLQQVFGSP